MTHDLIGLLACSRYSFGPNSLHFCGPEKQNDLLGYVTNHNADNGLIEILDRFETLYPYLALIASQNGITDPYDRRVVEAYWVGNSLLSRIKPRAFAAHLTDTLSLRHKIPTNTLTPMVDSVIRGVPHHTIHVIDVFIRTGHAAITHTLSTMDNCRIGWGRVCSLDPCSIEIRPLTYKNNRLILGAAELKHVSCIGLRPTIGDWVSVHWGHICDVVSESQVRQLMKYTNLAIRLANTAV